VATELRVDEFLGPAAGESNDWLMWQLADSAFPTGGFAHSNGLEAAWQNGELQNPDALEQWLETSLCQVGHGSLCLMTATHDEPQRFPEFDQLCECFTLNHVANRASRLQGKALLATARRIFCVPGVEAGRLGLETRLQVERCGTQAGSSSRQTASGATYPAVCSVAASLDLSKAKAKYGHLAPTFGAVTRGLGLSRVSASRLFMFLQLRGSIAAAVRLGIVGPLEAQAFQYRLGGKAELLLTRLAVLQLDELAQTAPLLEIWQGTQDRLYSRLFQS